ncbi:MAG: hypothetical protein K0U08_03320 [Proteobacteria bacterium]|nr:hypothetical protein [Pseudomonadota bacterium]
MPLTLSELKKSFDKAYCANQTTREKGADDLVFYWVTQWDDSFLSGSDLAYKGEFNILRKAGRQIMSMMRLNPVQPDFHPKDENREDDAEVMDGFYRATDRRLESQEAYDAAMQDQVVCGFGAWELTTKWKTNSVGDERQIIERRYIPEANNTLFFDPNSRSLDKREAKYSATLKAFTEDGYKELYEELTGEECDKVKWDSFASPEQSFAWVESNSLIYVVTFYQKEKVKDKVLTLEDPLGQPLHMRESQLEGYMDDLIDQGYEIVSEKEINRTQVTKYIASGSEILNGEVDEETGERKGEVIAGSYIPIIPVYGEHVSQVEGVELWEGVTRLAKDPQRLRNFQMSYLADVVSRSPRPKPIFAAEQIAGYEFMYEGDNSYPYYLQKVVDASGNPLPIGPLAEMPEQRVPSSLHNLMDLSRQAVEDVANAGVPQDIADPDLSGKAVGMLQQRIDNQSYIFQQNAKYAKRLDAEIFASMASEIMDLPQRITIETPDGKTKQVELMNVVVDEETGNVKTLNDLTNLEFDVYADIGPTYENQKEQTVERLTTMLGGMTQGTPLYNFTVLKLVELLPGVEMDDLREYARNELILQGLKDPETEEEIMMLQQAQQAQQQPDPNTIAAQGALLEGKAAVMKEEREQQKDFVDAQFKSADMMLREKKLNIEEANAQVKAAQAGVSIRKTLSETRSINIDNQSKRLERITLN